MAESYWIDELLSAADAAGLGEAVARSEPMAPHTSLRVGGPADLFVRVHRLDDLRAWVLLARRHGVPYFVLGRGTNILVADAGIRGLVIASECGGWRLEAGGSNFQLPTSNLRAESGASLPGLAHALSRQGWAGLEWAIGIPATVGAAVINNAGAYGSCIADVLRSATVMDTAGQVREWLPAEFEFSYRYSKLKGRRGGELVLAATFELRREEPEAILTRIAEYTAHRRRTQPSEPSVGSVFKNPPNDFAGRLLEQAGLKGFRLGGALVSPLHANWIVNIGEATASDVWAVIQAMRRRVREQFGVELELEIERVGDWS
jgi:UDP-N-acetylmuramate dehydrogenase